MSLYDDAAVALIAEGAAGRDHVLYNIKPEEKLKATERVANGDFLDGANDWTVSGSDVSITGGKIVFAGSDNYEKVTTASSSIFEIGKTYKVSFQVKNFKSETGAKLLVQEAPDVDPSIHSQLPDGDVVKDGNYSVVFTAVGNNGSNSGLVFKANNTGDLYCEVDNVSVKEVEQAPKEFTFTRGSNLTATRIGPDGLIEKGRENLFTFSNDPTNAAWTKSDITVTSGQAGYDGSSNAFKLTKTAVAYAFVAQTISDTGVKTISVYAKKGSLDVVTLFHRADGNADTSKSFNLTSGSLGATNSSNNFISASIENVGGGWYRCSMVYNHSSGNVVRIYPGWSDAVAGDIFIQNAQLERGIVATDYIDSPGGITGKAGILEDSPRFDYTGVTCPHLLMEPTRTNKVKYTEAFGVGTGNGGWQKVGITVTQNNAISPEGVQNASLIVPSTSVQDHYIDHGTHFSNVGEYLTISLFAKVPVNGNQYLYMNSGGDRLYAIFNLSGSGSIEQVVANGVDFEDGSTASNSDDNTNNIAPSASITALENGWFRCVLTGKAKTTAAGYIRIGCAPTDQDNQPAPTAAGDGNGMLIYGSQVEAGAFATSYIPNHGIAFVGNTSPETGGVTRNFDTTDAVDFSDYMDGKDITFFADLAKNPSLDRDSASTGIRFGKRNNNLGAFRIYRPNPNTSAKVYWADNDNDPIPSSHTISAGRVKVIVRRVESTGEFTVFYAGAQKYQASNTDFDDFINLRIRADGQPIFINSILVFDRALTDDECKSLTTV